jgi:hypothetical protein
MIVVKSQIAEKGMAFKIRTHAHLDFLIYYFMVILLMFEISNFGIKRGGAQIKL